MQHPFRYSYRAEIEIHEKKEKIWAVLTDLDRYSKWNPFTPKIETDWQIGHEVLLTVNMKNDKKSIKQKEVLTRWNPPDELAWGMNWSIFLRAERVQRLTTTNGSTNYFTEDIIEGVLSPIVHLIYGKYIRHGFEKVAVSLKKYIENS